MKKYDELLRRVEMFEKLAIYGNRKEFLTSIAQANAPKREITLDDIPQWQKDWSSAPISQEQKYWDEKAKGPAGPPAPAAPAPAKPKPAGYTFNSDVFKAQQRLRSSPYSFKDLEVDGFYGPNTRAHLQSYKQQVGNPSMSDSQAIKALVNEGYSTPLATPLSPHGKGEATMLDPKITRDPNIV